MFIGCTWCNLRTQRCWCVTPCGVPHCNAAFQPMPTEGFYPKFKIIKREGTTWQTRNEYDCWSTS